MKTWKVLPTDPRYQELTAEQRELLWEDFLLDHPDIAKEVENKVVYDDEFDQLWEELDQEEPDGASEVDSDDWEYVDEDAEGGES